MCYESVRKKDSAMTHKGGASGGCVRRHDHPKAVLGWTEPLGLPEHWLEKVQGSAKRWKVTRECSAPSVFLAPSTCGSADSGWEPAWWCGLSSDFCLWMGTLVALCPPMMETQTLRSIHSVLPENCLHSCWVTQVFKISPVDWALFQSSVLTLYAVLCISLGWCQGRAVGWDHDSGATCNAVKCCKDSQWKDNNTWSFRQVHDFAHLFTWAPTTRDDSQHLQRRPSALLGGTVTKLIVGHLGGSVS